MPNNLSHPLAATMLQIHYSFRFPNSCMVVHRLWPLEVERKSYLLACSPMVQLPLRGSQITVSIPQNSPSNRAFRSLDFRV